MGFLSVSDASFGNARANGSQGGHVAMAVDTQMMTNGGLGTATVLSWRSGRLHRVVSSTMAAETYSLSRALGDLGYTVSPYNKMTTKGFHVPQWGEQCGRGRPLNPSP